MDRKRHLSMASSSNVSHVFDLLCFGRMANGLRGVGPFRRKSANCFLRQPLLLGKGIPDTQVARFLYLIRPDIISGIPFLYI